LMSILEKSEKSWMTDLLKR